MKSASKPHDGSVMFVFRYAEQRAIELLGRPVDIEDDFVKWLFFVSNRRRANADSKMLVHDAYVMTLKDYFEHIEEPYNYDSAASTFEKEVRLSTRISQLVSSRLRIERDSIFANASLTNDEEELEIIDRNEHPIETCNRSLDFIEMEVEQKRGSRFLQLKRKCHSLIRVHDAMFGRFI